MIARRPIVLLGLVALLVLSGPGCVDLLLRVGVTGCDPMRTSTVVLPSEIDVHARVRMQLAGREAAYDAIVQRRGEALQLVGLAPAGPRLFALRQRGREIDFVATPRGPRRALALRTLDALHRGLWATGDAGARESGREAAGVSIDYRGKKRSGGPTGYEIRNPDCGYEASIVLL